MSGGTFHLGRVEVRFTDSGRKRVAPVHTVSVMGRFDPVEVKGKRGRPVLLWWNLPDDRGVALDVRAEDFTDERSPYLLVFHSQPLRASRARSRDSSGPHR